jgi:crotonobetainyl-CoA:carnitine CoA-transferase CaiB-like acyl-CoA transferase
VGPLGERAAAASPLFQEERGVAVSGPLDGVRVLEFAGMGPAPFAVMMLADMGAEVVRVDRLGGTRPAAARVMTPAAR